jgi:hypothetical protein
MEANRSIRDADGDFAIAVVQRHVVLVEVHDERAHPTFRQQGSGVMCKGNVERIGTS